MAGYYKSLEDHPDLARVVGWESRLAQLTRFEVVRALTRPGDRVIDLGAGLGDLSRYLALSAPTVEVTGLETHPPFIARALSLDPPVRLIAEDAFAHEIGPGGVRGEVAAALGALVDGSDLTDDGRRFGRLRRLFSALTARAARIAVAIVAKQEAIEADPLRSQDPALGGLRLPELAWLIPEGWHHAVRDDLLPTDRVVLLGPASEPLPALPDGPDLRAAAAAHPLAARVSPSERARFHLLSGELDAARAVIATEEARPGFRPDASWTLLRERLALMARSGVW